MQAHYRGAIRSGFVSHADEDDEDVLGRIRVQALLDADWLVNKVGAWGGCRMILVFICPVAAATWHGAACRLADALLAFGRLLPFLAVPGREGSGAAVAPQGPLIS